MTDEDHRQRRFVRSEESSRLLAPEHRQDPGVSTSRTGGPHHTPGSSTLLSVVVGVVLLSSSVLLQLWNESQAITVWRALQEGSALAVSLRPSSPFVGSDTPLPAASLAEDGSLVHLVDVVHVPVVLEDREHGVSVAAVRLKRRVQMYQWMEEETARTVYNHDDTLSVDSEPTVEYSYHYYTAWRDRIVDSSTFNQPFGHENPKDHVLSSWLLESNLSYIGVFEIGDELRALFTRFTVFAGDERPSSDAIKLHGDVYYHCSSGVRIEQPQVGDTRVQFAYSGRAGDTYSVVAMLSGRKLLPFTTSSGHQLLLLQAGRHSVQQLFHQRHAISWRDSWLLRAVGWVMSLTAIHCLKTANSLGFLSRLAPDRSVFSLSMSLSLLCVACSWLIYRPLLSLLSFLSATLVLSCLPGSWRSPHFDSDVQRRFTVTRPNRHSLSSASSVAR